MAASSERPRPALRRRQRGDMLLESMIAMLLLAIGGMGPAYVGSRIAVAHKQMNTSAAAAAQLRQLIETQGAALCGTTPTIGIAGTNFDVTVTCTAAANITLNGVSVAQPGRINLSVTSVDMFGGGGQIVAGEVI